MTKGKKIRNTILAVAIPVVLALFIYHSFTGLLEQAREYRNLDQEQIEIVSDYFGIDRGRITSIEKIIQNSSWDGGWIYIFADADWPGLWTENPRLMSDIDSSQSRSEDIFRYPKLFQPQRSYRYNREILGFGEHQATIHGLEQDGRIVIKYFYYPNCSLLRDLEQSMKK